MEFLWTRILLPVLELLYLPCDWVLGWCSRFGPVTGVAIVGVLSGVAVILVQKYGSRQDFLARCKADLARLKQRQKAAKASGDREALERARALQGRIGGKYMGAALKPALWTVPIIGLIGLWCGSRLGFLPLRPGDEVRIVAHFEDRAEGFAHVLADGGLEAVGPAISPVGIPVSLEAGESAGGPQARWTLKAKRAGTGTLRVNHQGRSHELLLPVAERGGRPPEPVSIFSRETPGRDALQAVEVKLADSMPAAWWNLGLQWGGLYLLTAVGVALLLRFALRVQ
jgi:uncharacterized membrane protein (DUF106 family)